MRLCGALSRLRQPSVDSLQLSAPPGSRGAPQRAPAVRGPSQPASPYYRSHVRGSEAVSLAVVGGLDLDRCRRLPGGYPYGVRPLGPLDVQDDVSPLLRRAYGGKGGLCSVGQGVQDDEGTARGRPGRVRDPLAGVAVHFGHVAECPAGGLQHPHEQRPLGGGEFRSRDMGNPGTAFTELCAKETGVRLKVSAASGRSPSRLRPRVPALSTPR